MPKIEDFYLPVSGSQQAVQTALTLVFTVLLSQTAGAKNQRFLPASLMAHHCIENTSTFCEVDFLFSANGGEWAAPGISEKFAVGNRCQEK
ncbi:MAG: hypothetical protein Q4C55_05105 [Eubacterium sp.]|nr:hypothetical protein [Eubacterium sp.]